MLHRISGTRDGVSWPAVGEEIELPEWEARNLIGVGYAVVPSDAASVIDDAPGGAVVTPAGQQSPAGPAGAPVEAPNQARRARRVKA